MIKLFRTLFEPREALPPHVHFHADETGRQVLCDESVCRPSYDALPLSAALWARPR